MELAFGARLPGNTPQRHEADPPGIGINQRSITTTTWHSPELAAHGSPGRHPRRLGNPPTGFLSCKPQTTALPRSPDVYRDPRLSPDVYQESLLSREPSSGTGQPTQTQRAPSPGFGQARGLSELTAQLRADTWTLSPQTRKPTNWITNVSAQINTSQTDSKHSPGLAAPLLTKSECLPANRGPDSTIRLRVL